jgi:hypothetical protein
MTHLPFELRWKRYTELASEESNPQEQCIELPVLGPTQ